MLQSQNKISIVVPVYNVEPYIEDCLRSVGSQRIKVPVECIVVDDCGTDHSMDKAQEFINKYSGPVEFRICAHKRNRGLSAARNTGMDAATGNFLYFLDSDDELLPGALQILLEKIIRTDGCDFVVGGMKVVGTELKMPGLELPNGTVLKGKEIIRSYTRNEWYMMACGKLYSTDFLKRTNMRFLEGIINEDELWSFQTALRAKKIAALTDETYLYKVRPGSIMTDMTLHRKLDALTKIYPFMVSEAEEKGLLGEKEIYFFLQGWFTRGIFLALKTNDKTILYKTYSSLRAAKGLGLKRTIFATGMRFSLLKRLVVGIHWLFPNKLGSYWLSFIYNKHV